jgi:hypothetical protein
MRALCISKEMSPPEKKTTLPQLAKDIFKGDDIRIHSIIKHIIFIALQKYLIRQRIPRIFPENSITTRPSGHTFLIGFYPIMIKSYS